MGIASASTLAQGLLLLIAILSCGCRPVQVVPVTDPAFRMDADEVELWDRAKRVDGALQEMNLLRSDEKLQAVLDETEGRLLPALGAPDTQVRVRVIDDPLINAFAAPNGSLYVFSGLLAVIDNEDELAAVLGHESVHFIRRHGLLNKRTAGKNVALQKTVAALLTATTMGIAANPAVFRMIASIGDYSRDLERDADARAMSAAIAAGYDPVQAAQVLYRLQDQNDEGPVRDPFLGSHPAIEERILNYRDQLEAAGLTMPAAGQPAKRSARYDDAIADLLLRNAELDANLGRFDRSRAAIRRHLEHAPNSAKGYFALGEMHRRRRQGPGDADAALAAYEKAVELDPDLAPAQRELGLLYRDRGRANEAANALSRYVKLAPDAADRPLVEAYLTGSVDAR